MTSETQCAACNATIPAGSLFCAICGAQQPPACPSCRATLVPGAAFCGACGAAASVEPQPAAAPTGCASCQAPLTAGLAFCENCGVAVGAAPAAPRPPTNCPQCDAPLREGARFCRKCGTQTGATASPARVTGSPGGGAVEGPRQLSAQTLLDQLTWSSAAAGAGFIVAAISPFLTWASVGGFGIAPFDSGARFRLGDVLGSDSIDGFATVLAALAGLVALVAFLLGRLDPVRGRYWIAGIGGALAALGVIEIQFVASRPGSIDIGFGLYLLTVGGLLAAASPWIPANKLGGQSR